MSEIEEQNIAASRSIVTPEERAVLLDRRFNDRSPGAAWSEIERGSHVRRMREDA